MKKLWGIVTIFLLTLALISPASATELFQKDLKYGTTNNSEVKKLQQYLKDKNYYSGPISGNYYSLTRTALMKLQKSYGLKQTGKFDSVTRNRLNKTLALMIEVEDRTKELEELQESQRLAELDKIIKAQLAATQIQKPIIEQPRTEPIQEPQIQPVQPATQSATQPTQPEQTTQQNNQTTQTTPSNQTVQNQNVSSTNQNTPSISLPTVTTINWNYRGINTISNSMWNEDRIKPIDWTGYGPTYPYYYFVNCDKNDPDNSWKTENVTNSTLGKRSVITNGDAKVGSFWVNGIDLNQKNTGPFIKSVTVQNIGTADLSKIGLVVYTEEERFDIGLIQYGIMGYRKPLTILPTYLNSNSATFILPDLINIIQSNSESIYAVTSSKIMEIGFKIDPNKMKKGETLKLKVVDGELTSSDKTKNYILNLPVLDTSSDLNPLIKCDVRN